MGNLFKYKKFIDQKSFLKENKRVNLKTDQVIEEKIINNIDDLKNDKNQFERFDTYNGLFNTQQLLGSVDFSDFKNHCFFDSAISKVEASFNKIYDEFPVDGSEFEVSEFLREMDGFCRFLYNKMDKNIGYLKFDGNSYIDVINTCGFLFSLSRNENILKKISSHVLSPLQKDFSIDFRIYLDESMYSISPTDIPIFQYAENLSASVNGFSFYIKEFISIPGSKTFARCVFLITDVNNSGSKAIASFLLPMNSWEQISIVVTSNNVPSNNKNIDVFLNTIKLQLKADDINFATDYFFKIEKIFARSAIDIDSSAVFSIGRAQLNHVYSNNANENTLNFLGNSNKFIGYIDEFRFYHKELTQEYIISKRDVNEFSNDLLKLYFRFNEPTGVYANNSICFDGSGNSLHSRISVSTIQNGVNVNLTGDNLKNHITSLRYNPQIPFEDGFTFSKILPNIKFENDDYNPVLFPNFQINKDLNDEYLEKARNWDEGNPNLIFKLFPKHYFSDGAEFEGLPERFNTNTAQTYYIDDNTLPGEQRVEAIQTFANLLVIWARFFDEIKLYLDIMPKLIDTDYSDISSAESAVNFFIPLMAKKAGFQFKEIIDNPTNKILDGFILGADGVDKSQYTLRYIQNEMWKRILVNSRDIMMSKGTKSAIKSVFNSIGINYDNFYTFREFGKQINSIVENNQYVKKVRSLKLLKFSNNNFINNVYLDLNLTHLHSNFKPNINGNNYTIEFLLDFSNNQNRFSSIDESIFRLTKQSDRNDCYLELFYEKESQDDFGKLTLKIKNNDGSFTDLIIDNINLVNKMFKIFIKLENFTSQSNKNVISLNCNEYSINKLSRSDSISFNANAIVRPAIFVENITKNISFGYNSSLQYQYFTGNVSDLKIWGNSLSQFDIDTHCLDIFSISNFEYLKYEKISDLLLLHISCQDDRFYSYNDTSYNNILLIDFSQNFNQLPSITNQSSYPFKLKSLITNNIDLLNNNIVEKSVINYEINIKFDEQNIENKVNIMSYQDLDLALKNKKSLVPVHEVNYFDQKRNDIRFSIEMSNVKHLNEDIAKLFSDISFQTNVLSDFCSLNDPAYTTFEKFSDFYFKRITSNKLQITPLYEIYQIFDNILTEMLSEFISSRVKFSNNVYVIESHALERHKYYYKFSESHSVMTGDMSIASLYNSKKSKQYLDSRK